MKTFVVPRLDAAALKALSRARAAERRRRADGRVGGKRFDVRHARA